MVPSGSLDTANFASVDPLLDGGEADTQFQSGVSGREQLLSVPCQGLGFSSWPFGTESYRRKAARSNSYDFLSRFLQAVYSSIRLDLSTVYSIHFVNSVRR